MRLAHSFSGSSVTASGLFLVIVGMGIPGGCSWDSSPPYLDHAGHDALKRFGGAVSAGLPPGGPRYRSAALCTNLPWRTDKTAQRHTNSTRSRLMPLLPRQSALTV